MENPNSYCTYVKNLDENNLHRVYHDTEYGFVVTNDNELFGRLILEINQAGLSWTTILKKKENFRNSFSNFHIQKVANYKEKDIQRLLNDVGIIRNKLKINAIIFNAKKILIIQKKYGSFYYWLRKNDHNDVNKWVKLFKENFKFTGGEITKEFLMSIGILEGAHDLSCPIVLELKNKFMEKDFFHSKSRFI